MTPEETAICEAVKHHVHIKTPLEHYGDIYKAVAETLATEHSITISYNTLQCRYEKYFVECGGVDSRKYCQKAMKKYYDDNPLLKKPTYPDPTDAVAKMHEPMKKTVPRETDEFAEDMGASLQAARDDQTLSFSDTLTFRPATGKQGQQGQQQQGGK